MLSDLPRLKQLVVIRQSFVSKQGGREGERRKGEGGYITRAGGKTTTGRLRTEASCWPYMAVVGWERERRESSSGSHGNSPELARGLTAVAKDESAVATNTKPELNPPLKFPPLTHTQWSISSFQYFLLVISKSPCVCRGEKRRVKEEESPPMYFFPSPTSSLTQLWRSNISQHSALLCLRRSHFETEHKQLHEYTVWARR